MKEAFHSYFQTEISLMVVFYSLSENVSFQIWYGHINYMYVIHNCIPTENVPFTCTYVNENFLPRMFKTLNIKLWQLSISLKWSNFKIISQITASDRRYTLVFYKDNRTVWQKRFTFSEIIRLKIVKNSAIKCIWYTTEIIIVKLYM